MPNPPFVVSSGVVGQSTSQAIVASLREAILSGSLSPDQRLTELQLASVYKVSRTPIREALRHLEAEGLVDYVPNRQVVVRNFTAQDIEEIYELRILLEVYGTRRAAERISDSELSALARLADQFDAILRNEVDSTEAVYELVALNAQFHGVILLAGSGRRLYELARRNAAIPLVYHSYVSTDVHRKMAGEEHRHLIEALRDRDVARAEELMRQHLKSAKEFILQHIAEEGCVRLSEPATTGFDHP